MKSLIIKIAEWVVIFAFGVAGILSPAQQVIQPSLAGNNAVGGKQYFLSGSGISASQTTVGLTKFEIAGGTQKLVMTDFGQLGCGTIEPGNSTKQEFVSFTGVTQNADGTATLTGISRGLSPIPDYTASTTQQKAHAGGSSFVISNSPPCFYQGYANKTLDEAVTGLWNFNSYLPTSSITATSSNQLITKAYADALANSGSATSTEINGGIVELANYVEVASSTPSTAQKPLVIQAQNATSTPVKGCNGTSTAGALCIVVGENDGKLNQLWYDLTEAFTWTGNHTFNGGGTATTTFNRGVSFAASSAQPIVWNNFTFWSNFADETSSSTIPAFSSGSGSASSPVRMTRIEVPHLVYSKGLGFGIVSNTASTTLMNISLPGGLMGTSSAVVIDIPIGDDTASGNSTLSLANNGKLHIGLYYGSQSRFLTLANATGGTIAPNSGHLRLMLQGSTTPATQEGTIELLGVSSGVSSTFNGINGITEGSFTIDSTSAQTLKVEVREALSSSADTFFVTSVKAEYWPYWLEN